MSPDTPTADHADLSALFLNCSLKPSPQLSHTQALMDVAIGVMQAQGVRVETVRAVDHEIAPGVQPDMTEHGFARDDWPQIWPKVLAADILVLGTPLWLGEKSSVATGIVERLYAQSADVDERGLPVFYGKVGGVVITGNEDGGKHASAGVLYALQHIGYTIPPDADAYWLGEAGPGPSYADEGSGGPENAFTQRNAVFMAWNLMHVASLLKRAGGIPAQGNVASEWEEGARFGHPDPKV